MVFIEKSIPLYLQSDSTSGKVDLTLSPVIDIPTGAKNVTVELVSATLHNTFHNLTGANAFMFTVTQGGTPTLKTFDFSPGAYDIESIQEVLDAGCLADPDLPDTLFELIYNPATQRVSIRVDFTQQGVTTISSLSITWGSAPVTFGIRDLLGFESQQNFTYSGSVPSAVSIAGTKAPGYLKGPDTIQVRSSLVTGAVDRFGHNTNILAEFPASAKGSRIHFEEAFSMPHEFFGADRRVHNVSAHLTDQDGNFLTPVEREYQLQILIKYLVWLPAPDATMSGLVGAGAGYRGY